MILVVAMSIGLLSGCGKVTAENADLRSYASTQEVLEYYAQAMNYDTIISRNVDGEDTGYVMNEVKDDTKKAELLKVYETTKNYLASNDYVANQDTIKYLDTSNYNYIRALLNDKALEATNGDLEVKQALGYYFITEQFKIKPSNIGSFKDTISLIGINGTFYKDYLDIDRTDNMYITNLVTKMNEYFTKEGLSYNAAFDGSALHITDSNSSTPIIDYSTTTIEEPEQEPVVTSQAEQSTPAQTPTTETPAVPETTEVQEHVVEVPEVVDNTITESEPSIASRTTGIDIKLINSVVGYGNNTAYIPDLSIIYNYPDSNGISGIGLYPSGALGLSEFGFDRSSLDGTCELTFVYKEDLAGRNEFSLVNIYSPYWEITTGFSSNNDNLIPEFLEKEFSVLIDRADRVIVNCDITGLASGSVFADVGMGVLQGYKSQYTNILRQISTVRRLISRDIKNNAYLLEVETFVQEGSKSADAYGSYKDKNYVVVQQINNDFIITDWMTMSHQMVVEPDIDPDASNLKRITALGLTGDVTDETKEQVIKLLNNLYTASTNRQLYDSYDDNGNIESYGMYDRFNSNVEMLSSSSKESINSKLRSLLVREGVATQASMYGTVTEWIGGTENQVELTTEELIVYEGKNLGTYLKCYYLVSCMEDTWVIDELQILEEESISGEAVNNTLSRLK